MDRELASKIRALAFASRCLSREMELLRDRSGGAEGEGAQAELPAGESDRLVELARAILDPTSGETSAKSPASPPVPTRTPESLADVPPALPTPLSDLAMERAPSDEHVLALYGQGAVLPLHELISFLGTVGKTGILRIETANETFVLEFQSGDIVHGEASRAPQGQRLGDLLVAMGAIERDTLERILEEGLCFPLGRHLLRRKLIDRTQLTEVLRIQIQALFNRLFRTEKKSFSFWSGPPFHAEAGVRLNTTSVLLEGARFSDEVDDGLRMFEDRRVGKKAESGLNLLDEPRIETVEENGKKKAEEKKEEEEPEAKAESTVPAEAVAGEVEVSEEKE